MPRVTNVSDTKGSSAVAFTAPSEGNDGDSDEAKLNRAVLDIFRRMGDKANATATAEALHQLSQLVNSSTHSAFDEEGAEPEEPEAPPTHCQMRRRQPCRCSPFDVPPAVCYWAITGETTEDPSVTRSYCTRNRMRGQRKRKAKRRRRHKKRMKNTKKKRLRRRRQQRRPSK